MMLSGRPPFNGRTRSELYWKIRNCCYDFEREEWAHVSDAAKDLIRGMLTVDPANRVNARDVLESKWFRVFAHCDSPALSLPVLDSLTKFQYSEGLRRAALTYMAAQTDYKNEEDVRKLFLVLDTDGDGKLSREEIIAGFSKLSLAVDVDDVLTRCDADCNGFIEYTEFIAATTDWRNQISESNLKAAFQVFDLDANGHITFEEFIEVIGDQENGKDTWKEILSQADVNGDGMIDFKEFKVALEGKKKRRRKRVKAKDVRRAKSHQPKEKRRIGSLAIV
jgi:calcium-dependent protein kinase